MPKNKSAKDAYETGQWMDPESFLKEHDKAKALSENQKGTAPQLAKDITLHMLPLSIDPDGNDHISLAVREKIKSLTVFFVENIRTARRYISSLNLGLTIEDLTFYELDKKTKDDQLMEYLDLLKKNKQAGLMSESGLPGVADPGAKFVSILQTKGLKVQPYAGPSSLMMALMASGLDGQHFSFIGYLPVKPVERKKEIRQIEQRSQRNRETIILIETPYRNDALLKDMINTLSGNTKLCIAKGISGSLEMIKTMTVKTWKSTIPTLGKVPTVFLIQS